MYIPTHIYKCVYVYMCVSVYLCMYKYKKNTFPLFFPIYMSLHLSMHYTYLSYTFCIDSFSEPHTFHMQSRDSREHVSILNDIFFFFFFFTHPIFYS